MPLAALSAQHALKDAAGHCEHSCVRGGQVVSACPTNALAVAQERDIGGYRVVRAQLSDAVHGRVRVHYGCATAAHGQHARRTQPPPPRALLQHVYRLAGPWLEQVVPVAGGGGGGEGLGGFGGGGLGGFGGGLGAGAGGGEGHGGGAPWKNVLLSQLGCTHSLPFSTGKLLLQPKMSEPLLTDHSMPCR